MKVGKKAKKFRLLFDAAFAKPETFTRLKKKANLAHVVHTFGKSEQVEDEEIYQLATIENRFVITINHKHFKRLARKNGAGIISIPPYLSNEEIDKILVDFVSTHNPDNLKGTATRI